MTLEPTPATDSLVLYKGRAARVRRTGKKLEIEVEAGQTLKVRPKDVVLLHPGPLQSLDELRPEVGEVETAWELLAGSTTSLVELAELAYARDTPSTAWAAWQWIADGLYFRGTPDEVIARSPEAVAEDKAARETQAAEARAWAAFLERVRASRIGPEDAGYLQEVEEVALGQRANSRVLRELGRAESPESAHALLLELGIWDRTTNPYPRRLGLATALVDARLPELPAEERLDLTYLPAFAIDDEGNQEPDDALSLEGSRLWVHVADVAALVGPDSEVDLEARARGSSLYLPEGTVPMLPPTATQALGLGLADLSPALSFGLDLDSSGQILRVDVVPSWVRVTRLTYEQAESQLGEEPLCSLDRLAQIYRERRQGDGAVFIELPEVRVWVESQRVVIRPLPALRSRDLVTEAMLMTGEAVARLAIERDIPIPYATQAPPHRDDRPEDLAGMFALRRAMRPSQPSSTPAPHAGLGLEVYVQATSPLRRYLDLVVHQQVRAHLRGKEMLTAQEILERVGATAAVAGAVRQAERLSRRHWTLVYLMEHPNWRGDGILVEKYGLRGTVLIPELDLDAHVHLRQDQPPNSPISLALTQVDLAEQMAHFQVLA